MTHRVAKPINIYRRLLGVYDRDHVVNEFEWLYRLTLRESAKGWKQRDQKK